MTKSIFKSWTFYFGLAQIVLGSIGYLSGLMDTQASTGLIITGVTSIGLRIKTNSAVTVV